MQIQQLAYFVAVARERHFTRAAELTGVSQPSLSKQIRVLENSLGTPLFVRNRGAIELTSAGEALLPHAQRILIDLEGAQQAVHEVSDLQRGRVRLGATPSMCDGLLPEVLTAFHARHPGIELEVQEAGSGVLTRELSQGRLDVALLIVPLRTDDPDLETTVLLTEDLVLASPRSATLPDSVEVAALADLDLVMFREGYDLREVTLAACRQAGFAPRLAVEGGEMSAVLRFVEAGLGVAVVPRMALATRPHLKATRLTGPALQRTIALAHRREDALPLAARAFRRELLDHLA
ncbi:LysR substrate binding domain protein [Aeromicrobium marinum DSM 15272]|uniref:LysR substrate binding domain protein n=1 Tax=Aeromicrobium marinum DSM 15272 TaxID=585531 RepID=E2SFU9_9ACTN|nr:LysR substrate-binding domain-containing protein [Aeromicrobium marinum]EFQ81896.1 LysR substrate binding domain protein [Aeromicrobium marinum DSM 15272]